MALERIAAQDARIAVLQARFDEVTNGFRYEWGAETYAAFRSVVSTAKADRGSVYNTIRFAL